MELIELIVATVALIAIYAGFFVAEIIVDRKRAARRQRIATLIAAEKAIATARYNSQYQALGGRDFYGAY